MAPWKAVNATVSTPWIDRALNRVKRVVPNLPESLSTKESAACGVGPFQPSVRLPLGDGVARRAQESSAVPPHGRCRRPARNGHILPQHSELETFRQLGVDPFDVRWAEGPWVLEAPSGTGGV